MSLIKVVIFGVVLWALMFAAVSVFIAFDVYENSWMEIGAAVIGFVLALVLAGLVKPRGAATALLTGLIWAGIGLALDYLVTARFNGEIFKMWTLWLGYALVLIAPLLRIKKPTA